MLKIKDNVDLKELEKFGFVFDEPVGMWVKQLDDYDIYSSSMIVYGREIVYDKWRSDDDSVQTNYENTLRDLIQAGLVEKVSGK